MIRGRTPGPAGSRLEGRPATPEPDRPPSAADPIRPASRAGSTADGPAGPPDPNTPRPTGRPHLRDGDSSARSGDADPGDARDPTNSARRRHAPRPPRGQIGRGGRGPDPVAGSSSPTRPGRTTSRIPISRARIILRPRRAGQGFPPIPGGGGGRRERRWIFRYTKGIAGTVGGNLGPGRRARRGPGPPGHRHRVDGLAIPRRPLVSFFQHQEAGNSPIGWRQRGDRRIPVVLAPGRATATILIKRCSP
jgi:hypothetical protein